MKRFLVILALLVPVVATAQVAKTRVWASLENRPEVRGSGFVAHERVTVTVMVSTGERFVREVTATDTGSFIVQWAGSATGNGPCISVFVKAAGDRGSTAIWRSVANDCTDGPTQ